LFGPARERLTNKRQNSYGPLTLGLINKFKLLPQGALCMEDVVNFLTTVGLFIGQPSAFFDLLRDLAQDADQARRER
jgi:hypothetical protein